MSVLSVYNHISPYTYILLHLRLYLSGKAFVKHAKYMYVDLLMAVYDFESFYGFVRFFLEEL